MPNFIVLLIVLLFLVLAMLLLHMLSYPLLAFFRLFFVTKPNNVHVGRVSSSYAGLFVCHLHLALSECFVFDCW